MYYRCFIHFICLLRLCIWCTTLSHVGSLKKFSNLDWYFAQLSAFPPWRPHKDGHKLPLWFQFISFLCLGQIQGPDGIPQSLPNFFSSSKWSHIIAIVFFVSSFSFFTHCLWRISSITPRIIKTNENILRWRFVAWHWFWKLKSYFSK